MFPFVCIALYSYYGIEYRRHSIRSSDGGGSLFGTALDDTFWQYLSKTFQPVCSYASALSLPIVEKNISKEWMWYFLYRWMERPTYRVLLKNDLSDHKSEPATIIAKSYQMSHRNGWRQRQNLSPDVKLWRGASKWPWNGHFKPYVSKPYGDFGFYASLK